MGHFWFRYRRFVVLCRVFLITNSKTLRNLVNCFFYVFFYLYRQTWGYIYLWQYTIFSWDPFVGKPYYFLFSWLSSAHSDTGSVGEVHCQSTGKWQWGQSDLESSRVTNACIGSKGTTITGARLDARTYTFAHPRWRMANAEHKHGAMFPVLRVIFD